MNIDVQKGKDHGPAGEQPRLSWLDRQFIQASGCALIALALLFNGAALVLGMIGLVFCKHPKAREGAGTLCVLGAIATGIGLLLLYALLSQGQLPGGG